ncbi:MAG: L,D-transpeptidase family protein [bacterium]|nr:L,D-transpeptidase family protein [bacterium]
MRYFIIAVFQFSVLGALCPVTFAHHMMALSEEDADMDGLTVEMEGRYGTDPVRSDTDGDGYLDGDEVGHGYDPSRAGSARLAKRITVDLSEQRLWYAYGDWGVQGSFLISSGKRRTPTPIGTFAIQAKRPVVLYRGADYYYPNTKWNLQFLPHYYIHGAWWHNNFGSPMSHGCVNAPYGEMKRLYAFADAGTEIVIRP